MVGTVLVDVLTRKGRQGTIHTEEESKDRESRHFNKRVNKTKEAREWEQ
jgi:hypothetical protein